MIQGFERGRYVLYWGNFTFGRAGRSAGEGEIRQGVLAHGLCVILCGFFDGTNEVIERPVPFHLSFEDEDPVRFRESSLFGDDPGVLEILQARKDLRDPGDFDEVFQFVWSRRRRE